MIEVTLSDSVDFAGLQRAADEICLKLDEVRGLLKEALPHLRDRVASCEACEGAGVVVSGTSDEDACEEVCECCKDIQDLIARIEPRLPRPAPQRESEDDDDIAF